MCAQGRCHAWRVSTHSFMEESRGVDMRKHTHVGVRRLECGVCVKGSLEMNDSCLCRVGTRDRVLQARESALTEKTLVSAFPAF